MPITVSAGDSRDFTPAPEGLYRAVCIDVVDKGMQETQWGSKHKVQIRWSLDEIDESAKDKDGQPAPRPFMIVASYTASLHQKAKLRQNLESWRGRRFTEDELRGFDLERLVGVNCQLQIVHSPGSDGSVYANVQAIVPAPKGVEPLKVPSDYVRVVDRDKQAANAGFGAEIDSTPF